MGKKQLPQCDEGDAALSRLREYLEMCRIVLANPYSEYAKYWAMYVALGIHRCLDSIDTNIDPRYASKLSEIAKAVDKGAYSDIDEAMLIDVLRAVCSELSNLVRLRRFV